MKNRKMLNIIKATPHISCHQGIHFNSIAVACIANSAIQCYCRYYSIHFQVTRQRKVRMKHRPFLKTSLTYEQPDWKPKQPVSKTPIALAVCAAPIPGVKFQRNSVSGPSPLVLSSTPSSSLFSYPSRQNSTRRAARSSRRTINPTTSSVAEILLPRRRTKVSLVFLRRHGCLPRRYHKLRHQRQMITGEMGIRKAWDLTEIIFVDLTEQSCDTQRVA